MVAPERRISSAVMTLIEEGDSVIGCSRFAALMIIGISSKNSNSLLGYASSSVPTSSLPDTSALAAAAYGCEAHINAAKANTVKRIVLDGLDITLTRYLPIIGSLFPNLSHAP